MNKTSKVLITFIFDLDYFKHLKHYRYIVIHFEKNKGAFGVYPVSINQLDDITFYKKYIITKWKKN